MRILFMFLICLLMACQDQNASSQSNPMEQNQTTVRKPQKRSAKEQLSNQRKSLVRLMEQHIIELNSKGKAVQKIDPDLATQMKSQVQKIQKFKEKLPQMTTEEIAAAKDHMKSLSEESGRLLRAAKAKF